MSNLIFIRFRRGDINNTRDFYICQGLFNFFIIYVYFYFLYIIIQKDLHKNLLTKVKEKSKLILHFSLLI